MIQRCKKFICGLTEKDNDLLPEIESFNQLWRDKASWQRKLCSDDVVCISKSVWNKQIEALQYYINQVEYKETRIEELEEWIAELEKGKEWLEKHAAEQEQYIQTLLNEKKNS